MSIILECFEGLLDAQAEGFFGGVRQTATVGSVANKDAVIGQLSQDGIFVAGGQAESGGFALQMRKSDFATPPVEGDDVTTQGQTLQLLSFTERAGVYEIIAGDPSTEVT